MKLHELMIVLLIFNVLMFVIFAALVISDLGNEIKELREANTELKLDNVMMADTLAGYSIMACFEKVEHPVVIR